MHSLPTLASKCHRRQEPECIPGSRMQCLLPWGGSLCSYHAPPIHTILGKVWQQVAQCLAVLSCNGTMFNQVLAVVQYMQCWCCYGTLRLYFVLVLGWGMCRFTPPGRFILSFRCFWYRFAPQRCVSFSSTRTNICHTS